MNDLAFGIIWYDDPSIFRLLESLQREATKYVIDGKFRMNPATNPLSNNHMRRKISKFSNIELVDAPDLDEPEKRQKYLDLCVRDGKKFLFIIDSDEYIISADWDKFYARCQTLDFGIHLIQTKWNEKEILMHPRLWVNPSEWKYDTCHFWFSNSKTGAIYKGAMTPNSITFKSVMMGTDDSLRSEEWNKNTLEYQKKLWEFEKQYPR